MVSDKPETAFRWDNPSGFYEILFAWPVCVAELLAGVAAIRTEEMILPNKFT